MYAFLVVVHVLSVMVLLGPAYALPYFGRPRGEGYTPPTLRVAMTLERVSGIGLVVQLFSGIGLMVMWSEQYGDKLGKQVWLHIALTLFIVLAGVGTGFNMPRTRKALAAAEQGDGAEAKRILAPVERFGGPIASLLGVVILVLMVWQPGR